MYFGLVMEKTSISSMSPLPETNTPISTGNFTKILSPELGAITMLFLNWISKKFVMHDGRFTGSTGFTTIFPSSDEIIFSVVSDPDFLR